MVLYGESNRSEIIEAFRRNNLCIVTSGWAQQVRLHTPPGFICRLGLWLSISFLFFFFFLFVLALN